jgi:multiple sugar transport system substrate-binding protein
MGRDATDVDLGRTAARKFSRRDFLGLGVAGAGLLALGGCGGVSAGGPAELNALFMKQAAYSEADIRAMTEKFQKQYPEIKVNPTFVAYEALHDKIVAAAPAGTFDVVLVDVIWPTAFASKRMIVDVTNRLSEQTRRQILPGALETVVYENRYYGIPWIVDTKYLYYNEEMLGEAGVDSPPATWDEAVAVARDVKSRGVLEYPLVWTWGQAEALMCDYAQLLGAFGGQFLDEGGNPAFNTGGGVRALEFMKMTLDEGITNPASLESLEEDVRRIVSQGNAAMALNWTYMYALANDPAESQVAGQVKVARTPEGPGGAPGVNGSMGLCVTAGSRNPDAAWKYVEFMTGQELQEEYAELSLPVWQSSYGKEQVRNTLPALVPIAEEQLKDLVLRPQIANYNRASLAVQVEIQRALNGDKTPQQALDDAAQAVQQAQEA